MSKFVGDPIEWKVRHEYAPNFSRDSHHSEPTHRVNSYYDAWRLSQERQTLAHLQEFMNNLRQREPK